MVGLENCEFVDSTGIALFRQIQRQLEGTRAEAIAELAAVE